MRATVLSRLTAGDKLHMQLADGRREWWFEEPRLDVSDKLIQRLRASGEAPIVEAGDSLFGLPDNSQTWGGVDVPSDRTPCINPRCRRTFKADDGGSEVICGKCFRTLPAEVRNEHRRYWREIRKWDRRITRTADELKIARMREIRDRLAWRLSLHWDREIKARMLAPDKPEGLDAFLEEVGL
jgi:hypothetical protein